MIIVMDEREYALQIFFEDYSENIEIPWWNFKIYLKAHFFMTKNSIYKIDSLKGSWINERWNGLSWSLCIEIYGPTSEVRTKTYGNYKSWRTTITIANDTTTTAATWTTTKEVKFQNIFRLNIKLNIKYY